MDNYIFKTPAFIQDLQDQPAKQLLLNEFWSLSVGGWIKQAMPPSPSYFYDPSEVSIPSSAVAAAVNWTPLPGRLLQYFSKNPPVIPSNPYNLPISDIYQLADTGYYDDNQVLTPLPDIPANMCPEADWSGPKQSYGPFGPRGWQDEYCEWAVQRNTDNKIVRVDFCCENPEYWYALWNVSPAAVVDIYNTVLNYQAPSAYQVTVTLEDLQLKDTNGNVVIDPGTGHAAYNPLNKWNSGPFAVRGTGSDYGGAIHLTSTPNTLQTELGLAGAATILYDYDQSNQNPQQARLCCGKYGQAYRNSDPTIGFAVGTLVAGSPPTPPAPGPYNLVNLANPPGLYIQAPDPTVFSFSSKYVPGQNLPADAQASDIWQVVRGSLELTDPVTGQPFSNPNNASTLGNFVLHATAQIPASWLAMSPEMTLNDILINNSPIEWGGQIAEQMHIALYARPLPAQTSPQSEECSSGITPAGQPLQCMYAKVWDGYYPQAEPNPTKTEISLASNTTFIPSLVHLDDQKCQMVVTTGALSGQTLTVSVLTADGSAIDTAFKTTVTVTKAVTYAVPGNSYPGNYSAVYFDMVVPPITELGSRTLQISVNGSSEPYTLPAAFLLVA